MRLGVWRSHESRPCAPASYAELDLLDQAVVNDFFARQPIDQVYLAAARVGGILANHRYPTDFIY